MRLIALLLAFISTHSLASEIIEVTDYHADEASVAADEPWLALQKLQKGWRLVTTKPRFRDIDDPITGSGIRVSVTQKNVRLLLADEDLKPGPVENLLHDGQDFSEYQLPAIGKERKFVFKGIQYTLKNRKGLLQLAARGRTQALFRYSEDIESNAKIVWLGDLDGDEKLDLVLDASEHYNVGELRLYLSRNAESDKLVRLVAKRRTTGC